MQQSRLIIMRPEEGMARHKPNQKRHDGQKGRIVWSLEQAASTAALFPASRVYKDRRIYWTRIKSWDLRARVVRLQHRNDRSQAETARQFIVSSHSRMMIQLW
jgi:hypothetical protein